jgi:hypothetical protein
MKIIIILRDARNPVKTLDEALQDFLNAGDFFSKQTAWRTGHPPGGLN